MATGEGGALVLRERLARTFGTAALDRAGFEILEDEDGCVVAQVGGCRVALVGGFLVATIVVGNLEHLGVVGEDGRTRLVASVEISPSAMN